MLGDNANESHYTSGLRHYNLALEIFSATLKITYICDKLEWNECFYSHKPRLLFVRNLATL